MTDSHAESNILINRLSNQECTARHSDLLPQVLKRMDNDLIDRRV